MLPEMDTAQDENKPPRVGDEAYRQRIFARKCLNKLVDVRLALLRQNRTLEIVIDQLTKGGSEKPE